MFFPFFLQFPVKSNKFARNLIHLTLKKHKSSSRLSEIIHSMHRINLFVVVSLSPSLPISVPCEIFTMEKEPVENKWQKWAHNANNNNGYTIYTRIYAFPFKFGNNYFAFVKNECKWQIERLFKRITIHRERRIYAQAKKFHFRYIWINKLCVCVCDHIIVNHLLFSSGLLLRHHRVNSDRCYSYIISDSHKFTTI